jgi:hypothetical protein
MDANQAKKLIEEEAFGPEGMNAMMRMGDDPGPERFARLLGTLRTLFDALKGKSQIDRTTAHALWSLGTSIEANFSSWQQNGKRWRPQLGDEELPNLLMAVESVLSGEWMGEAEDE